MSQIFLGPADSNMPPDILTSFAADISTTLGVPPASGGSSSPVAHVERITGDNGIVTLVDPAQLGLLALAFSSGSTQTTDAIPKTIIPFTIADDTALTIQVIVIGRNTAAPNLGDAIGGYCTATIKNVGGTVSEIGPTDIIVRADTSLIGATFTVGVSGAQFIVQVQGLAGKTIDWEACLPGIVQVA